VTKQLTDEVMDRRVAEMVIVVQDEDERSGDAVQLIGQRVDQVIGRR